MSPFEGGSGDENKSKTWFLRNMIYVIYSLKIFYYGTNRSFYLSLW